MRFWAMNVQGGYGLFIRGETGNFVNVANFIATYGCNGPTARTIANNLSRVLTAMNRTPGPFRDKASTGVSLVKLLRITDSVLRSGSSPNDRRPVHPFSSRR